MNKTSNKPYNFVVIGCKVYVYVQSVAPKNTCRIICLLAWRLAIHACEWPLKNPTNVFIKGFEGVFNANLFSVLAVHIEGKMIIYYE